MAKKHANKQPAKRKKQPTKKQQSFVDTLYKLMNNLMINLTTLEQTVEMLSQSLKNIDTALTSYIEFKGDDKAWREWVQVQIDKIKKEQEEKSDNKS